MCASHESLGRGARRPDAGRVYCAGALAAVRVHHGMCSLIYGVVRGALVLYRDKEDGWWGCAVAGDPRSRWAWVGTLKLGCGDDLGEDEKAEGAVTVVGRRRRRGHTRSGVRPAVRTSKYGVQLPRTLGSGGRGYPTRLWRPRKGERLNVR